MWKSSDCVLEAEGDGTGSIVSADCRESTFVYLFLRISSRLASLVDEIVGLLNE